MKLCIALGLFGLLIGGLESAQATRSRSPRLHVAAAPKEKTPRESIGRARNTRYYRKENKPNKSAERGPKHKDFNYDQWGR